MLPTAWQIDKAREYGIPIDQAHTISYKRFREYVTWRRSERYRWERAVGDVWMNTMLRTKNEYMYCEGGD